MCWLIAISCYMLVAIIAITNTLELAVTVLAIIVLAVVCISYHSIS